MSYQVIARKWRPQNFDQLVGQSHVSQTLLNAIKNQRIHPAILLTGPRGTGKTSTARIVAKSLRCEKINKSMSSPSTGDVLNPCNVCQECEDIGQGQSVNVIEIDGASNNGVDSIRSLLDGVSVMPSAGHYKIYIIDEVHMLSTSAFNALLKTLEEPPEHVKFILATTEVHKIPQTILSRCQRFDFRRISTRLIADQLKFICREEGLNADDDALWLIAHQGDGSMRDSQSLMDQVITFSDCHSQGFLNRDQVLQILGLTDRSLLFEGLSAIIQRDSSAILQCLEKIARAGYEPQLFMKDFLGHIRNLLVIKLAKGTPNEIVDLPDSEIAFLRNLGEKSLEEDLHFLFDMSLKGAQDLVRSSEPRMVLEMVLLRMALAPRTKDLSFFLNKLSENEAQEKESGPFGASFSPPATSVARFTTTATAATPVAVTMPASRATVAATPSSSSFAAAVPLVTAAEPVSAIVAQSSSSSPLSNKDSWLNFVQKVRVEDPLFAAKIENLLFINVENQHLTLAIPAHFNFLKIQMTELASQKKMKTYVEQFFGNGYSFEIKLSQGSLVGTSAQTLANEKQKKSEQELFDQLSQHPKVRFAQTELKGQIIQIKEIKS